MDTENGLPPHGVTEVPGALPEGLPRARIALDGYGVIASNGAFAELVGRTTDDVLGLPVHELWPIRERPAIAERLEDVVILGYDAIGALALSAVDADPVWVEIEARYAWRGGERLELALRIVDQPPEGSPLIGRARPNGAGPTIDGTIDPETDQDSVGSEAEAERAVDVDRGSDADGSTWVDREPDVDGEPDGEDATEVDRETVVGADPEEDSAAAGDAAGAFRPSMVLDPDGFDPSTMVDPGATVDPALTVDATTDDGTDVQVEAEPFGDGSADEEQKLDEVPEAQEYAGNGWGVGVGRGPAIAPAQSAMPAESTTPEEHDGNPGSVGREGDPDGPTFVPVPKTWFLDEVPPEVRCGINVSDAAGVAVLALTASWRVEAASSEAVRLCGVQWASEEGDEGPALEAWIGMASRAKESMELARRDGRRQTAHAVARVDDRDLVVEWVPGGQPGRGWMVLSELPGEDPTTARILLAELHVYHIAHDAKNQLAEIYEGLESMARELERVGKEGEAQVETAHDLRERLVEDLSLTRAACASAIEVIDDVHEETEAAQGRLRDLDLGALVSQTLMRYAPRTEARAVTVEQELAAERWVRADRARLRRVLTNLFDNALRAMPEGGRLSVTLRDEDHERPGVLMQIADTGVGISAERLERIFLPGDSTAVGGKGRGVGIVRRFVLDHGGEIRCESTEGEGTTFHIWLPRIV